MQTGLPPALKPVEDQQRRGLVSGRTESIALHFENAMRSADNWFARNMRFDVTFWTHYYMYGFERYKSFQELVEGQTGKDPVPAWYRQGVEFLRTQQQPDGSWKSPEAPNSSAVIDTSFAVLFLARSSQQTIEKTLLEGQLRSGKRPAERSLRHSAGEGQIVSQQAIRDVEDMLKLLGERGRRRPGPVVAGRQTRSGPDPAKRDQQLERLRRLVDHKNYQIRLKAVKSLGSIRDLQNVPTLIHGLSDPDRRVAKAALDALRFTSRKFVTPDLPPEANPAQVRAVQDYWKNWYQSIDPNAAIVE